MVDMYFTTELYSDMHRSGCGHWVNLQKGLFHRTGPLKTVEYVKVEQTGH
jgi:hypothetical protein